MAQANAVSIICPSRFHNLANEALADALGNADAVLKGAETECKLLKDEFKRRGLTEVAGEYFTVTAIDQISGRLDTKAVKEYLGGSYHRFENVVVSTVIRIKCPADHERCIARPPAAFTARGLRTAGALSLDRRIEKKSNPSDRVLGTPPINTSELPKVPFANLAAAVFPQWGETILRLTQATDRLASRFDQFIGADKQVAPFKHAVNWRMS